MNAAPEQRVPSLTVEEFAVLPEEEGLRLELSGGRIVREPAPGPLHGHVAGRFYRLLWRSGEESEVGLAFFDTAFALARDPATVRIPDAAFVSAGRIPVEGLTTRFWELAPDIVVEVVSPSNRATEIQEKALQYLDAGSELVWIADPEMRSVTLYRSRADIRILEAGDVLTGDEVLPELRIPVSELFG